MHRFLVWLTLLVLAACGGGEEPPGPPAALEDLSGASLTGTVGRELANPLRVRVTDGDGRGVPGVAVNFTVTAGGGLITQIPVATASSGVLFSVAAVVDSTDANGESQARWTLGTGAGEQRASVTVAGAPTLNITAQATTDEPADLVFAPGSAFIGIAGQPADGAIIARVADQFGNPVEGITVTWAAVEGGGSVGVATSETNASGNAETTVILGPAQGLHLYTASAAGLGPDTSGLVAVVGETDPTGDAFDTGSADFPSHDVTFFGGAVVENVVVFHFRFTGPVAPMSTSGPDPNNALLAYLEFDTDQDSTTGFWPLRRCAELDSLGLGVDLFIDLDPTSFLLQFVANPPPGAVPVTQVVSLTSNERCDFSQEFSGTVAATVPAYRGSTVSLAAPLSVFAGEPVFDFTSLFINFAAPALTDIVPDSLPYTFDLSTTTASRAAPSTGRARYLPEQFAFPPVSSGLSVLRRPGGGR